LFHKRALRRISGARGTDRRLEETAKYEASLFVLVNIIKVINSRI
jgi:hypothetical protein